MIADDIRNLATIHQDYKYDTNLIFSFSFAISFNSHSFIAVAGISEDLYIPYLYVFG